MFRFILILLFFCAIGQPVFSQDNTSGSSNAGTKPVTKTFTERDVQLNIPAALIDTGSNYIELYSPAMKQVVYNDLGNVGLPVQSLIYKIDKPIGFNYSFNPYEVYFLNPEKNAYINTKAPFTDMKYTQGGGELLMLNIKHSQNILPRWNVGAELNRVSSQGYLLRQYSSFYGVNAFTSYFSKQKHYLLLANLTWNFGLNEESGGIRNDSSFEALTGGLKQVYTRMGSSETHYRNRSVYVKQFYRFGNNNFFINSGDSVYEFIPHSQFVLTSHASQLSYSFKNGGDTNSLLLPNLYYDVKYPTYDSVFFGKFSNKLEYQIFLNNQGYSFFGSTKEDAKSLISMGMKYELINVAQPVFVRQYQNIIVDGNYEITSIKDNKSLYNVAAAYVLQGNNQGDYKLEASAISKYKLISLTYKALLQQNRPDFIYQLYKSNQFIWKNQFAPVSSGMFAIGIKTNTLKNNVQLQYKVQTLNNFVYFDSQSLPTQNSGPIQLQTIELSKTFQVWKFRLEHLIYYQNSSSSAIRIPELSGIARYYFQSKFFGISKFQLGFNILYNTAYYGNGYNPAIHQFILQNEVKIGNYPVINPFFIADIKRATAFVVYEHVNMDLIKTGMYYTAHYPIALSNLRMGVRWRLYE